MEKISYTIEWLKEQIKEGREPSYIFFWKHYPSRDGKLTSSCLSQWWESNFEVEGVKYWCMEQFMMAEKARLFGDQIICKKILNCRGQKEIKALGRQGKRFDEQIWQQNRGLIVLKGNIEKFSQGEELKTYLVGTGDKVLVEASPYDKVWGIELDAGDANANNPERWKGLNLLGFVLMEVRDRLKS
ncbi:MAG: NADAR family protein [Cellulosilyticaceae bacterium]